MATIAEGGLFPPMVDAYLPAINVIDNFYENPGHNGYIEIPFNISPYNSPTDIKGIHVSITRQSNYNSIFNGTDYPMGIYVENVTYSAGTDSNKKIYINKNILNNDELSYNEYYKVQLRLSKDDSYDSETGEELSEYLTNESNLASFSEWSTVCLIRFIAPPVINIQGDSSNRQDKKLVSNTTITSSKLTINGNYKKGNPIDNPYPSTRAKSFKDGTKDKEYLSSYDIKISSDSEGNNILYSSGVQDVNIQNPNQFEYTIPYYFKNNENVYLHFYYITANLYEETLRYTIQPVYNTNSWGEQTDLIENTSVDNVIGKVNVYIEGGTVVEADEHEYVGSLSIRRGSDQDNFSVFDTFWHKEIYLDDLPLSFDDFTIESGVLYKYEITFNKYTGNSYTIVEGPIMSVFDHAFLTGEGTQLCVRFNPNIGSFSRKVSDNIINTIGGKYPYITRNSAMDYRVFSLSGTIAYEMDAEHQFSSRSAIYGDWINVYGSYFVNHYFNQRNDRVTQRKFRELVMDYLYDDIPKLFRSTPEGNILVRITDVSLTPNQQLSRMIYDFTCTATEIGEANIDNYKLYKIQDFGD